MSASTAPACVKPEPHPRGTHSAALQPQTTLRREWGHFYIRQIEEKRLHMAQLRAAVDALAGTPDPRDWATEDAMRAGAYALEQLIESYVDTVRERGCLLHVGCPQ